MNHFVITFLATINGTETITGTIGSVSATSDYKPNIVINTITQQYKKQYGNVPIAVKILGKKLVTSEQYKEAAKNFIELELNVKDNFNEGEILKLSYDMRENLRVKAKEILHEGQQLVFDYPIEVSFEKAGRVTALNWEGKLFLDNVDMTKIGVPAFLPQELQQMYNMIENGEYQIVGHAN